MGPVSIAGDDAVEALFGFVCELEDAIARSAMIQSRGGGCKILNLCRNLVIPVRGALGADELGVAHDCCVCKNATGDSHVDAICSNLTLHKHGHPRH